MIQSRQIEAFRAVMLTGAMTAAAETIHVTQPAVSRLIRDLEAELGLALFQRRGNRVLPTPEARALLIEVERSFVGLGQIRAFAGDIRSGRGGMLRIAVLPAMATGFAPRFVAKFCRERPNLKVSIYGLPSPAIRDRVTTGELDLGIMGFPVGPARTYSWSATEAQIQFQRGALTIIPLDDKAVLAVPAGHRLAGRQVVLTEDLRDETLILLNKDVRHPINVALQSVPHRQVIDTPLSAIACTLVLEGMGVAVVDPFSASEFVGRGIVLRPLEPAFTIGTAIVHSTDRRLSLIAQEFLAGFLDHTRQFLARTDYLRL
jgi:DNA-binding transcriptional LysR family regulator